MFFGAAWLGADGGCDISRGFAGYCAGLCGRSTGCDRCLYRGSYLFAGNRLSDRKLTAERRYRDGGGVLRHVRPGHGVVPALNIDFDLHTILFGDVLGVDWTDVWQSALIAVLTVGVILAKRRDLLVLAFDPQHAKTIGLPVAWLHYGLLVLLSVVIVSGLKAVGITLIIALLIAPGAIAHLITDRFDRMLIIACAVSSVASIVGVMVSFHLDSATAPTIVLVLIAFFLLAFFFAPRYGIVAGRLRRGSISEATE